VLPIAIFISGISREHAFYFAMLSDPQFGMVCREQRLCPRDRELRVCCRNGEPAEAWVVIVLGDLLNKAGDVEQIQEYKRVSAKIDQGRVAVQQATAALRVAFGS
jgi:hypothetical protein